ncbi:MAG: helix-turn-helix transcriptional regulator [Firmicutes bacterium]|nr:helix-turn-helix transcriptional regulator [Bacillota bacterium]
MENYYGNRLRELRLQKGYTQIKVQMKTGIDQSDYSKMETGKRYPNFQQAQQLSKLYETSVDYIFGITDEPRPYPRSKIMKKED